MLGSGRRARPIAIGILCFGSLGGPTSASAGEAATTVRVGDGLAAAAMRRALTAARRRLTDPECRRVLTDFTDAQGRPLQASLEERGQAPEDYLATILFYDGSALPACAVRRVLAATSPGSRAVFVCAPHVASVRNGPQIQALIIHEMLHTLGLGEDPPSSAAITARVVRRCGL